MDVLVDRRDADSSGTLMPDTVTSFIADFLDCFGLFVALEDLAMTENFIIRKTLSVRGIFEFMKIEIL